MKRTWIIHWIVCFALGMAIGSLFWWAIMSSNIAHWVQTIIATIALVLNIACGPDIRVKKKNFEE